MRKSSWSDKEKFYRELRHYRSIAETYIDLLEENSMLTKQLVFYVESARFYIVQLDVWDKRGDRQRYEEAVHGARKNLDHVRELIIELIGEDYSEGDDDE